MPIGRISRLRSSLSPNLALIKGVTEEVAQVSKTAVSGRNSLTAAAAFFPAVLPWGSPAADPLRQIPVLQFLQYHTGKGTPKYRCLEIHQSHFRFSTQLLYLLFI